MSVAAPVVEEPPVASDDLSIKQLAHDPQRFVHSAAAGGRVDTAHPHLIGVFAPNPDAEDEPAGRELSK